MQEKDAEKILERYNAGLATKEEIALVETWYLKITPSDIEIPSGQINLDKEESIADLLKEIKPVRVIRIWPRIAAAASILAFLSAIAYFYNSKPTHEQIVAKYQAHDIAPGSNKAILTLANGKQIILSNAKNGKLAAQITKTADGEIIYSAAPADAGYNTLTTPNGGQYEVSLPDGTKVWLNAASILKYPASFVGLKERRVELAGEAYFEVVHDNSKPFKVIVAKQIVEDIGTHFNINSYDQATKTTLLEGSISINNTQVLKPGQQAVSIADELEINNADLEEAVAWKNGYFRFNNETIKTIMPKLSHWYNIEVSYDANVSTERFYGAISRNKNISEVLAMLEQTQSVHFKIEGRRVTVLE